MKKHIIQISFLLSLSNLDKVQSQSLYPNPFIGDSGQTTIPTTLPFRAMEVKEFNEGYLLCGKGQAMYLISPGVLTEMVPNLIKVNACGELDSTYGINGYSEINFANTIFNINPTDYEINPDASVIIAGQIVDQPLLMKIDNLGFIDTTFINLSFTEFYELTNDVEGRYLRIDALPDSSYLCLVSFGPGYDYTRTLALIKVDQFGTLDTNFGNGGILFHTLENGNMNVFSSLRNSDGSYFVSGTIHENNFGFNNLEVIKLTNDMQIDTLFNQSGRLVDTTYNISYAEINKYSLHLNKLSNYLLISTVNNFGGNTTLRFSLMDLNGTVVNSFGINGFAEFPMGDYVNGLLSISERDNEFFASYSSSSLDTSFIVKLDLNGGYSNSFNNGQPLILGDGKIHISCIEESEADMKLFGGKLDNTFTKYLLYGNAYPDLTLDGNLLSANIDATIPLQFNWYLNGVEIIDSNISTLEISSPGEYVITLEAVEGCQTIADTLTLSTVDVELIDKSDIFLHPNPTSNILHVKSSQIIEYVEVYDSLGRLLYNSKFLSNDVSIPVYDFDSGIYYLRINNSQRLKFIVSN